MKAVKRVRNKSSAWVQYTSKRRSEIDGDLTFGQQVKQMSVEWANMNDEQKAPFVKMKVEDEARYKQEFENRSPDLVKKDKLIRRMRSKKRRQKSAQKRQDGFPKTPLSPCMFFSKQTRARIVAENPTLSFPDTGRALGVEWKALSAQEKDVFQKMHQVDKEIFEAAKLDYEKKAANSAVVETMSV